jgi:hypothetical protein
MADLFERLKQPPPTEEKTKQPPEDPTEKLLEWLVNHWNKPTITGRDFYRHGPNSSVRNNKTMILSLTQALEARGWLTPVPTWRHDKHEWRIVRGLPLKPTQLT